MSLEPDDRVLIKPLGVKGTVVRETVVRRALPAFAVQADSGGPPLVWLRSELEKLTD